MLTEEQYGKFKKRMEAARALQEKYQKLSRAHKKALDRIERLEASSALAEKADAMGRARRILDRMRTELNGAPKHMAALFSELEKTFARLAAGTRDKKTVEPSTRKARPGPKAAGQEKVSGEIPPTPPGPDKASRRPAAGSGPEKAKR
ncbi:MAG: hypothetical protein ACLFOY_08595 [Desulfatibacillaceae bacterium]